MFKIILLLVPILLFSLDLEKMSENIKKIVHEQQKKTSERLISNYSEKTQQEYKEYEKEKVLLHSEKEYILYFTSQSLDGSNLISMGREVSRLNAQNNTNAHIVPFVRGIDIGVFKYAGKLKEKLKNMPPLESKRVASSFGKLKVNPNLFKDFNITEVPVIVTAKCKSRFNSEECRYFYKMSGKSPLRKMMEIADANYTSLFMEKSNEN